MTTLEDTLESFLGPPPATGVRIMRRGESQRHLLLPALHHLQDRLGHVSRAAMTELGKRLGVPLAEVYGVASFYELLDLVETPSGPVRHSCDDIVCRRLPALAADDSTVQVPSPCLGQCDRAPAAYLHVPGEPVRRSVIHSGGGLPHIGSLGQPRLLSRVMSTDPTSLDDYLGTGGFESLATAFELGPEEVVATVESSGLRGRGGAAFPTGAKWRAVAESQATQRYVVCNADESEPGTFKDRVLMEGDPFALVESMAIAAFAVGANRAYVYIRGEYPHAEALIRGAAQMAASAGHLDLPGGPLTIDVRRGGGAYICGEETALFNSIEGYRGEPRTKPPYPTEFGLFGRPTVVNNVETLMNVPGLLGADEAQETKLFCASGDLGRPGTYEVPTGTTLGQLIDLAGGVVGDLRAVLLGGAAGAFLGPGSLGMPLTFDAARAAGVSLGSGVVMALNSDADVADLLIRMARFFREESCGQCVPCRVGTVRQHELLVSGRADRELLDDLAAVMADASICGLGHTASTAVQSALDLGLLEMTEDK